MGVVGLIFAILFIIVPVFLSSLGADARHLAADERAWRKAQARQQKAARKHEPEPKPQAKAQQTEAPKPEPEPAPKPEIRGGDMFAYWRSEITKTSDRDLIAAIAMLNAEIEQRKQKSRQAEIGSFDRFAESIWLANAETQQRMMYEEMISRRKQRKAKAA